MLTTTNHLINGNHVDGAVETPRPTSEGSVGRAVPARRAGDL